MFDKAMQMIDEAIKKEIFPSAAFAAGIKTNVLAKNTWGNAKKEDSPVLVNENTLYDLASLTKAAATTMIALKMAEQGILSLSDKVSYFFTAPSDKSQISVCHLMTHTAGFPAHFLLHELTDDYKNAVEIILNYPLAASVGEQTIYSCIGYILLGKILEKIGDNSLDILARQYVFDPLEMNNTSFNPEISINSIAPTEYLNSTGAALCGTVHDENARFLHGVSGNAGVFSTLTDMCKLASMLSCRGVFKNHTYLTKPAFDLAITNHTPGCTHNRGLGFKLHGGEDEFMGDLFSRNAFGHTGFTGTSLVIDPLSGLYVILLTNRIHPVRNNTGIIRFRNLLHNMISTELSEHKI